MRPTRIFLVIAAAALGSCKSHSLIEPLPAADGRVLFVGNSLTYTNDMPGIFRDIAAAAGYQIDVHSVTQGNTALIDFLYINEAMRVIDGTDWNFVVLQQGPTSLPVCRDTLVLAARLLNPHIRRGGGVPAVMMSWPDVDRQRFFPDVHNSFALAAQTVDGLFLPVGDAWLAAWKEDPNVQLYGFDGYHPGIAGSYLAALVVYEKLTGRDARELPANINFRSVQVTLPEETVRLLQRAAHAANQLPVPKVTVPATVPGPPITC